MSLSTSLGLSVLQGMRGEPREQGRSFFSAAVKAGVNALLAPVEQGLAERLRALRAGVRALASEVVPAAALDDAARAEALLAARASGAWAALGAAVDGAAALAENELTFDLYRFLKDGERLRALSAKADVATFLRAQTDGGRPLEVWVTGRRQRARRSRRPWRAGSVRRAGARWPVGRAGRRRGARRDLRGPHRGQPRVRGGRRRGARQEAAARRQRPRPRHARLGARRALRRGVDLHAGDRDADALQRLAAAVAGEVKALDYRHVDARASRFAGAIDASASGFLPQVIHQHLEAYIERAGLSGPLARARLFGSG